MSRADPRAQRRSVAGAVGHVPGRLPGSGAVRRAVRHRRGRVEPFAVVQFTRQLAALVRAGVAVTDALGFIAEETTDDALAQVVFDMVAELLAGGSLSTAASAHRHVFPHHYVGVLRSTEVSGRLADGLDDLAEHLQRDLDTRARLTSALAYPAIVLVLAVMTVGVLAGFVLPRFEPLFDELGASPPLPTRLLSGGTDLIGRWWLPMSMFTAISAAALSVAAHTGSGRAWRDRALLRTPLVGTIVEYSLLERFCRVLATMLAAGVPAVDAMRTGVEGVDNMVLRRRFEAAAAAMLAGGGFVAPLGAAGLFPGAVRLMLAVGEETGTLQRQLVLAADVLGRERDVRTRRVLAALEPASIVFVGLVVGFVAVALVSAMYGVLGEVDAV